MEKAKFTGQYPLDTMRRLMKDLGDPQRELSFIHVAGTNGKGSTSAFINACLMRAGFRVGLFTSPFLEKFNERIRVDGQNIPDEALDRIFKIVGEKAKALERPLTEFEMVTAAAFIYFKEEKCDYVVLEVGIGGLLDATNIIDTTKCACITSIGLDHVEKLGDTKEKIAFQKAGIIKENIPAVVSEQQESVLDVFRKKCISLNAPLTIAEGKQAEILENSLKGQIFKYKGEIYEISLLGKNQVENAVTAIEVCKSLNIPPQYIKAGLRDTIWAGRFEVVSKEPYFIIDCGHNLNCMESLKENVKAYFPTKKPVILTGVMKDKDFREIYDEIDDIASSYVAINIDYDRAMKAEDLKIFLDRYNKPCTYAVTIKEGIEKAKALAKENGTFILALGSVYIAGDIRSLLFPNGEVEVIRRNLSNNE